MAEQRPADSRARENVKDYSYSASEEAVEAMSDAEVDRHIRVVEAVRRAERAVRAVEGAAKEGKGRGLHHLLI